MSTTQSGLAANCQFTTEDKLEDKHEIGDGGFGTVFKANHVEWGPVAIKELKQNFQATGRYAKRFLDEVIKHSSLHNTHVVQFLGFLNGPKTFGIILEFQPNGSLDLFLDDKGPFTDPSWVDMKVHWAYEISIGMNYIHSRSPPIIHRDLKLANVLLDQGFKAKITDFGLSEFRRMTAEYSGTGKDSPGGTVAYTAPEIFDNININPTMAMDVYSYAILIWELFTELLAFDSNRQEEIRSAVLAGQRPPIQAMATTAPQEMINMTKTCWQQHPRKRPSFQDLKARLHNIAKQDGKQKKIQESITKLMDIVSNYHPRTALPSDASLQTDCSPTNSTEYSSPPNMPSLTSQHANQPPLLDNQAHQSSNTNTITSPTSMHVLSQTVTHSGGTRERPRTRVAGDADQPSEARAEENSYFASQSDSSTGIMSTTSSMVPSAMGEQNRSSGSKRVGAGGGRSEQLKYPHRREEVTQMLHTDFSGLGLDAPPAARTQLVEHSTSRQPGYTSPSHSSCIDLHPDKPDGAQRVLDAVRPPNQQTDYRSEKGKLSVDYSDRVLGSIGPLESQDAQAAVSGGSKGGKKLYDDGKDISPDDCQSTDFIKPDPCDLLREQVGDVHSPNALAAIHGDGKDRARGSKPMKHLSGKDVHPDSEPYSTDPVHPGQRPGPINTGQAGAQYIRQSSQGAKDVRSPVSEKESMDRMPHTQVLPPDASGTTRVIQSQGENSTVYNIKNTGHVQIGNNNTMVVGSGATLPQFYTPTVPSQPHPNVRGNFPAQGYSAMPMYPGSAHRAPQPQRAPGQRQVIKKKITVAPKVVTADVMTDLSNKVGSHWRPLGRQLGLSDADLDVLQYDHSGLVEIIYQMLMLWVQRNGETATLKVLAEALIAIKKPNLALELEKY